MGEKAKDYQWELFAQRVNKSDVLKIINLCSALGFTHLGKNGLLRGVRHMLRLHIWTVSNAHTNNSRWILVILISFLWLNILLQLVKKMIKLCTWIIFFNSINSFCLTYIHKNGHEIDYSHETCSCSFVQYFCTLFWDDTTIICWWRLSKQTSYWSKTGFFLIQNYRDIIPK